MLITLGKWGPHLIMSAFLLSTEGPAPAWGYGCRFCGRSQKKKEGGKKKKSCQQVMDQLEKREELVWSKRPAPCLWWLGLGGSLQLLPPCHRHSPDVLVLAVTWLLVRSLQLIAGGLYCFDSCEYKERDSLFTPSATTWELNFLSEDSKENLL